MSDSRDRRWLYSIAGVLTAAVVGLLVFTTGSGSELPTVTVYKSAACVCCGGWVEHMRDAGFAVDVVEDRDLMAVKADRHVPPGMQSCHTAAVDGSTVEGHVPAADVKRMLRERPPVAGIGVGGMPAGSPGMPGAPEPYAVETFTDAGATAAYAEH